MPGQEPTMRAALDLLGLAEGAGRDAVTRAYRRLARLTHPDRSDAPDAAARFAALTAAYRRALAPGGTPASAGDGSRVRLTVHTGSGGPSHFRTRPPVAVWDAPTVIGDAPSAGPPIVAGPVQVGATAGRPAGRRIPVRWGA